MDGTLYRYEALDLESHSFRLLMLHPGKASDEIQCDVFLANLDDTSELMPYEALSYTWGGAQTDSHVTASGQHLKVTDNLHLALQHLRHESEGRLLWVDAICIDQRNTKERGHQVQRMCEIYKKAERVVVWLGTATHNSNLIMRYLRGLQAENLLFNDRAIGLSYNKEAHKWEQKAQLPDLGWQHVAGFKNLLMRPWFFRVWIIQEVANARAAIIMCGNESISSRIFSQFPELSGIDMTYMNHQQSVLEVMPGFLRRTGWYSKDRNLRALLTKFRKAEAMQPVDRIFALLGIASDAADFKFIQPAYDQPLSCVIRRAMYLMWSIDDTFLEEISLPYENDIDLFIDSLETLGLDCFRRLVETGKSALARQLITSEKIELGQGDPSSPTALHIALGVLMNSVQQEETECVLQIIAFLLRRSDIDVEARTLNGETALSIAIHSGLRLAAEAIMEHRNVCKDLHSQNDNVSMLLDAAISVPHDFEQRVNHLLDDLKVNVNVVDVTGNTALIHAVKSHEYAITSRGYIRAFENDPQSIEDGNEHKIGWATWSAWQKAELCRLEAERAFQLVQLLLTKDKVNATHRNHFGRSAQDYATNSHMRTLLSRAS